MQATLKNDFHCTICTLRYEPGKRLSTRQIARCRRELCGQTDCTCGGSLGEWGRQPVVIIERGPDHVTLYEPADHDFLDAPVPYVQFHFAGATVCFTRHQYQLAAQAAERCRCEQPELCIVCRAMEYHREATGCTYPLSPARRESWPGTNKQEG